ncbi:MAG: sulfatase-like hydrolase/transferase [Verrucomicrobia bacterium]|nr:sulfatase-like hydrolase/transferase [Verrucomicrobiota bacterium]
MKRIALQISDSFRNLSNSPLSNKLLVFSLSLLGLLILLKICLASLDLPYLYQIHFRYDYPPVTFVNYILYGIFVALVFFFFTFLAKLSREYKRTQRDLILLFFLILGLMFVFLTFVRMKNNYFFPYMCGIFNLEHIRSYLCVDFFYEPPFIAFYLLAFIVGLWFFDRLQKPHFLFYLLGFMAVIFFASRAQRFLSMRDELLIIDVFGILGLIHYLRTRKPLPWQVWLVLIIPFFIAFLLFAPYYRYSFIANPYFVFLLSLTLTLFVVPYVLGRRSRPMIYLSNFLPFGVLAFFLFTNYKYPSAQNYNHLIAYGYFIPHYFIEELVITAVMFFTAVIIQRFSRIAAYTFFWIIAFVVLAFSVSELLTYRFMGTRIDWQLLTMSNDIGLAVKTVSSYLPYLFGGLAAVAVLFLVSAKSLQYLLNHLHRRFISHRFIIISIILGVFVLSVAGVYFADDDKFEGAFISNSIASSPISRYFEADFAGVGDFSERWNQLNFPHLNNPSKPLIGENAEKPRDLNVVLIVLESFYNKYLSMFGYEDETQPLLKNYADRMELFPNFFSNFPNSFHARFSVLNGLYSIKDYVSQINPDIECTSLFEILDDHNYSNFVFYSSYKDYTGLWDYLKNRGIDAMYDAENMPSDKQYPKVSWGLDERTTLSAMEDFLGNRTNSENPFLLVYIPAAPHKPFDTRIPRFRKFDTGAGYILNDYSGRFKNELLFMDWILTRLMEKLEETGLLDKTLVVMTSDHGEMVGEEKGLAGHGWLATPKLTNIPLIIMDPAKTGRSVNYTIGSQVDVLPTILDLLDISLPSSELYQGVSLYNTNAVRNRQIYLNSYRQRALITDNKYILEDPEFEIDGRNKTTVFKIENNGTDTIFTETDDQTNITHVMDKFEELQNALIPYYSYYKKSLSTNNNTNPSLK